LLDVEYAEDPVFGFFVPKSCDGVPSEVLDPASSWPSQEEYMDKYTQLATRFTENFRKFAPNCPQEIVEAGPRN
jgi:phosphoenolpyruvate carboxykinase (ATP)